MASQSYREFTPSHRADPDSSFQRVGDVPDAEPIEVSVYLKARTVDAAAVSASDRPREALRSQRAAAHAADFEAVRRFAADAGLTVVSEEPAKRRVRLAGTAAQMQEAFRTTLARYRHENDTLRLRSGCLSLPEELIPVVESVLGLDTRPAARPRLVIRPGAATENAHLPNEVAALYDFPSGVTGKGQCIALIELGGGFQAADTTSAFQAMGLTPPTVLAVAVDGGTNKPTPDDGADGEVALDIQVAGGAAPGSKLAVYFSSNTDAGFADAINAAVHDATNSPSVVSISWGGAESTWTAQAAQTMNTALQDAATLNVSVFVAAGDNLSTDGVSDGKAHVDFPASSPWAIGCGGTAITVAQQAITNEVVWNDGGSGTGGGISDLFAEPSFQQGTALPPSVNDGATNRRGVPDVAGDAAPDTGYRIVVGGNSQVVGGTSAVAPLWAGLAALINEGAGKPIGFFLPFLYAHASLLRQITQGNNIPSSGTLGYRAGSGWNACTGLGVPQGSALFNALKSSGSD